MNKNIEWRTAVTPLTVKQMWRASKIHSDAPFTLDGREIKWVYCVGHVVDIDDKGRFYMLKIDDGSAGLLSVFLWKNDEQQRWRVFADLLEKGKIAQNMYARVSGELKGSKGYENSITASFVSPIRDSHEIFFHLFECVIAAQYCEKLLENKKKPGEQPSSSDAPGPSSTRVDGEGSSKEEKGKDNDQSPLDIESSVHTAADESSDEELEYVTDPGHPDDSSDEGGGEKDLDDSDSEEPEHAHERTETVESGVGDETQASSEPATEPKGSAHELGQVQESLQVLNLTSVDVSNDKDPVSSVSQDTHDEPTPELRPNESAQEPDQMQKPLQTTSVTSADPSDDADVARFEAPEAHDEPTRQSRIASSASSARELNKAQESIQAMSLSSADRSDEEGASRSEASNTHDESAPESHIPQDSDPLSKLTNAQRALVLHIAQRRDEVWEAGEEEWTGVHISEMARVLKRHKNMSVAKIGAAVDDLIEAGYIFSTVDETRFDVRDS